MASSSWSWWGSGASAGQTEFDRIVEKCTSSDLPSSTPPSITDALALSDLLRSSALPASRALLTLRKRLTHPNPNVQLLAISTLDICIKNSGDQFLREVSSRDFSDEVACLVWASTTNHEVKDKLKRELQNWASALEEIPALSGTELVRTYRRLKHDGIEFPPRDPLATAAMVSSLSAPEWRDAEVCERCRTPFSFTNRKHHCRNCGGVFDGQCSSKRRSLPQYGVEELVRVCDGCDKKLSVGGIGRRNSIGGDYTLSPGSLKTNGVSRSSSFSSGGRSTKPSNHRHTLSTPGLGNKMGSAANKYEDDLAKAIALSLQDSRDLPYDPHYSYLSAPSRPPDIPVRSSDKQEEEDPDLAAAIAASLREVEAPRPSAPISVGGGQPKRPPLPSYDLTPAETDAFLTFTNGIENGQAMGTLDPRDRLAAARFGEMHNRALQGRPQLLRGLGDAERKSQILQEMNDKLSQAVKMYDRLLEEQLAYRTHAPAYQGPVSMYTGYPLATSPNLRPVSAFQQTSPSTYSAFSNVQTTFSPPYQPPAAQQYVPSTAPPPPPQQQPYAPNLVPQGSYPQQEAPPRPEPEKGPQPDGEYGKQPHGYDAGYGTGPHIPRVYAPPPQHGGKHTPSPEPILHKFDQPTVAPPADGPRTSSHATYDQPRYDTPQQDPHYRQSQQGPPAPQQPQHQAAPAMLSSPEEPSYYREPFSHYTAESFPTLPQTAISDLQPQHAQPQVHGQVHGQGQQQFPSVPAMAVSGPWVPADSRAHGVDPNQGMGMEREREEAEAAPLIDL